MRRVLVLRPEPGATATVEKARELGLEAIAIPLFTIEPVDWQAPDASAFDALLLTSANAVRCSGDALKDLRGLPVYAVGEATAEAARDAGFDIAASGDAGVDRLLGSIESDLKLLHLCGCDRKQPTDARQRITAIPVYRAVALAPDLMQASESVALVHSPRAGQRFAELIEDRSSIAIAAISMAAAEAVGSGWQHVESAQKADDAALLALVARLCNTSPPQ